MTEIVLPKRMTEAPRLDCLTARQLEVVQVALQGGTRQEMAATLGISADTLHNHMAKIYERLSIKSRAALFRIFLEDATITARNTGYATGYRHGYVDGLEKGRKEASRHHQEERRA
jgi:DNA-binding CsgD family transcriptional regulator